MTVPSSREANGKKNPRELFKNRAYEQLRSRFDNHQYAPGTFLSERQLAEELGMSKKTARNSKLGIWGIEKLRSGASKAFAKSIHFDPPTSIYKTVEYAKPIVSIGNQTGEGWFLTGEMVELIHEGVNNIVCTQPFGCLPNHVVGKGVIKQLRKQYPLSNIVAIDYDPGASEVNQLNRIKLMLSTANKNLKKTQEVK